MLIGNANAPTAGSRPIGALWEEPPASAHENLRLYVYHLRKALGDRDRVVRHPPGTPCPSGPASSTRPTSRP